MGALGVWIQPSCRGLRADLDKATSGQTAGREEQGGTCAFISVLSYLDR